MGSSLIIRCAEISDLTTITEIYAHAVKNGVASFELEAPDLAEMEQRFRAITKNGYPYIVAESFNSVVGYAYANSYRPRPAYRWSVENSVYVASDNHGTGVGRALLSRLISDCETCGYRQMIAVIGGADHFPSIALHRSLGFDIAGQLTGVGWKHQQWQDSVIMQRALGKGCESPPDDWLDGCS